MVEPEAFKSDSRNGTPSAAQSASIRDISFFSVCYCASLLWFCLSGDTALPAADVDVERQKGLYLWVFFVSKMDEAARDSIFDFYRASHCAPHMHPGSSSDPCTTKIADTEDLDILDNDETFPSVNFHKR
ncbi:hypothetical protein B9479_007956 [Cryptococcus floricola]|uniref:Uncharacterized protein n=1 Tax=Cryptococcus floricola TaxID=2591691 RepID=A0A5D3AM57_9TREE|nr:hypothetical protein B9479_007956 [Cryptococcus floricola]